MLSKINAKIVQNIRTTFVPYIKPSRFNQRGNCNGREVWKLSDLDSDDALFLIWVGSGALIGAAKGFADIKEESVEPSFKNMGHVAKCIGAGGIIGGGVFVIVKSPLLSVACALAMLKSRKE